MSRPENSYVSDRGEESGCEVSDQTSRDESVTSSRDGMAIVGFVCSLCVVLITVLLIPVANMPSTSETAGDVFVLLLLAGAVLWVLGLVLSLMARNKTLRHHKLAKAGTIVSVIAPLLFIAALFLLFLQALDWYFNDFFTLGVPTADPSIQVSA